MKNDRVKNLRVVREKKIVERGPKPTRQSRTPRPPRARPSILNQ